MLACFYPSALTVIIIFSWLDSEFLLPKKKESAETEKYQEVATLIQQALVQGNVDREEGSTDINIERHYHCLISALRHCSEAAEMLCVTRKWKKSVETEYLLKKRKKIKQTFNNSVQPTIFKRLIRLRWNRASTISREKELFRETSKFEGLHVNVLATQAAGDSSEVRGQRKPDYTRECGNMSSNFRWHRVSSAPFSIL